MKIRIIKDTTSGLKKGHLTDIDDYNANILIKKGIAEEVKAKTKKVVKGDK